MKSKIIELLEILSQKGSRIVQVLRPGLTEREIRDNEQSFGAEYPSELRDFLAVFGNGFESQDSVRAVDTQIMQDFSCMSWNMAQKTLENFRGSIVLGDDLFPDATRINVFPFLTSGGEYISMIWGEDLYNVVWKVNDYGNPSWVWPSMGSLLSFIIECWKLDYLKFDFTADTIDWNAEGTMSLHSKYGIKTVGDDMDW